MYNRLENYLESHDIIFEHQFGFRKGYSTEHALMSITEEIKKNLNQKMFSCGVFVDLEKAFDTVNHKILLRKLKYYGLRNNSLSWFASYLQNRWQHVTLNGVISDPEPVICGVPQGSILGPLLFLIYINDMNQAIKNSSVYHFADDTNLLYSEKNPKILKNAVNKDLMLLYEWLCANRLSLNVGKTEFMIFRPPRKKLNDRIVLTLNRTKLYESNKIKYLGILLDNKLCWKEHIIELSKKLNRSIGMLYKARHFCPTKVLRTLYFSIFYSHLQYGISVWGYATNSYLSKIKKAQKRAVRCITFSKYKAHSTPLFKQLNILSIEDTMYLKTASLLWDLFYDRLPSSLSGYFKKANLSHTQNTRFATSGNLRVGIRANSFQFIGSNIFNELNNKPNRHFQQPIKGYFLRN